MSMVVTGLVLTALVTLIVIAETRRNRKAEVPDAETVVAGRRLLDGRCFLIPIGLPSAPTYLCYDRDGPGCLRFTHSHGVVRLVHQDAAGVLIHVSRRWWPLSYLALVYVVDPSTGRPSLLRVPPGMKRARQAVAWTFGLPESDWVPLGET